MTTDSKAVGPGTALHPIFADILDTHAWTPGTPSYRGWNLNGLEYGYYTATHEDFDASYEGPEDGWVGSHPTMQGRTPEDLRAEIDAWFDEQSA